MNFILLITYKIAYLYCNVQPLCNSVIFLYDFVKHESLHFHKLKHLFISIDASVMYEMNTFPCRFVQILCKVKCHFLFLYGLTSSRTSSLCESENHLTFQPIILELSIIDTLCFVTSLKSWLLYFSNNSIKTIR